MGFCPSMKGHPLNEDHQHENNLVEIARAISLLPSSRYQSVVNRFYCIRESRRLPTRRAKHYAPSKYRYLEDQYYLMTLPRLCLRTALPLPILWVYEYEPYDIVLYMSACISACIRMELPRHLSFSTTAQIKVSGSGTGVLSACSSYAPDMSDMSAS